MNESGMKTSQLYFCYGDDMNEEHLKAACHRPIFLGSARLKDYRLTFVGYSKKWDGAVEALVAEPGCEVWGAVYQLSYTDGDILDLWKDIRLNGTGLRFHYSVEVCASDGTSYSALLYQKAELGKPLPPSREYLDSVIAGAIERGLPSRYIDELRAISSKPASYPVPKKNGFDTAILTTHACDCGAAK